MNMLETYNLQSSAYYSHLTEANYDLAAAAAAAAASNSLAASNQALQQATASASASALTPATTHMSGMLDHHSGQVPSVIPKLEFDKVFFSNWKNSKTKKRSRQLDSFICSRRAQLEMLSLIPSRF